MFVGVQWLWLKREPVANTLLAVCCWGRSLFVVQVGAKVWGLSK